MTDLEKVIKNLKDCLANQGCGYMDGVGELYAVSGEDLQNAIAMLKEQEPMAPIYDQLLTQEIPRCRKCGYRLVKENDKYCCKCGQAVKWG